MKMAGYLNGYSISTTSVSSIYPEDHQYIAYFPDQIILQYDHPFHGFKLIKIIAVNLVIELARQSFSDHVIMLSITVTSMVQKNDVTIAIFAHTLQIPTHFRRVNSVLSSSE